MYQLLLKNLIVCVNDFYSLKIGLHAFDIVCNLFLIVSFFIQISFISLNVSMKITTYFHLLKDLFSKLSWLCRVFIKRCHGIIIRKKIVLSICVLYYLNVMTRLLLTIKLHSKRRNLHTNICFPDEY